MKVKKDTFKSAFISIIFIFTQMNMGWFVHLRPIIEIQGQQQQQKTIAV